MTPNTLKYDPKLTYEPESFVREKLHISKSTLARYRSQGLPAVILPGGKKTLYHWPSVVDWINGGKTTKVSQSPASPQVQPAPHPEPNKPYNPWRDPEWIKKMEEEDRKDRERSARTTPPPEPKKKSIKWTGENTDDVMEFINDRKDEGENFEVEDERILINGLPFANEGEWIVNDRGYLEAIDETEYAERNHKGELE